MANVAAAIIKRGSFTLSKRLNPNPVINALLKECRGAQPKKIAIPCITKQVANAMNIVPATSCQPRNNIPQQRKVVCPMI